MKKNNIFFKIFIIKKLYLLYLISNYIFLLYYSNFKNIIFFIIDK